MEGIIVYILKNKEWLFSGFGITVLILVGRIIFKGMQKSSSQNIKSGKNSTNIQIGSNVNIGRRLKDDDVQQK